MGNKFQIMRASAEQLRPYTGELVRLLKDAVESGASVGYLPPVSEQSAREYWASIISRVQRGDCVCFVAMEGYNVVGSVQLDLATKQNGQHRAEVSKLMVHSGARRRGIGSSLMRALEDHSRGINRFLLVLDTRQGDVAELLYQRLGYIQAGVIPQYSLSASGSLDATVFYYKLLAG